MTKDEIIKGLMGVIESQKMTINVLIKRLSKAEKPHLPWDEYKKIINESE